MVTFSTDHYFRIGHFHVTSGKPCEDYAVSGVIGETSYAIVSDGCSSGGDTDIGARLMALGTARAMREHWDKARDSHEETEARSVSFDVLTRTDVVVREASGLLNLNIEDLLATRLYAYLTPFSGFVCIEGDGACAVVYRDGSADLFRVEWKDNMPFYPVYQGDVLKQFIQAHGDDLNALRLSDERWVYAKDGSVERSMLQNLPLYAGLSGMMISIPKPGRSMEDVSHVALFSDGVAQVENIDWKDAIRQFLAFKNTQGAFVKRRMIRAIRDMQKEGRGPIDDIAASVISLNTGNESEECSS